MTDFLNKQSINFVAREKNLRLCSQTYSVELIREILEKVYSGSRESKTIDQLKRRKQQQVRKMDVKSIQGMFSSIRKQLRRIVDECPYTAC